MSRKQKRERELRRYRKRCEADPAGEVAKFLAEMVAQNYVTHHEVDACTRKMDQADSDEERATVQRNFLQRLKARVEADQGGAK